MDLVLAKALIDARILTEKNKTFLVLDHLVDEPLLKQFICDLDTPWVVINRFDISFQGIFSIPKKISYTRTVRRNLDRGRDMVLFDKSGLESRFFIKNFSRVILYQQFERKPINSKFDIFSTTKEFLKSVLFGASFVSISRVNNLGAYYRYLKLFAMNGIEVRRAKFPKVANGGGGNKIVIFGSRYLSWDIYDTDQKERLERRLLMTYELIVELFPTYEYLYVPHPLECGLEYRRARNAVSSLKEVTDYFCAEHFLLSNTDIDLAISIASTSCKSAHEMGFATCVLYRVLPLGKEFSDVADQIFKDLPESAFANTLCSMELAKKYKVES